MPSTHGQHEGPTADTDVTAAELTRIMLRPVASPIPVGFLALAIGTFTLAGLQLRWIAPGQGHVIGLCLFALVAPLQLVSFVMAFLGRDSAIASGMGVLFGTWLTTGLVLVFSSPGSISGGLGLLLIAPAAALLVPVLVGLAGRPLVSAVLLVAAVRFGLSGAYELGAGTGWRDASAVVGLVLAALAWYAACAFEAEAAQHRPILPTFRTGPRSSPVPGASPVPSPRVLREAGVREQL
jgi:hypothetical protein